jgi:hypothetical protein
LTHKTITSEELYSLVPYGHLTTKKWLFKKGLSRHIIDNLLKSNQLEALTTGVYQRPGTPLKWQTVVTSLQHMGLDITVGNLTALELQGLSHYLNLSGHRKIHLYSNQPLPKWINKLSLNETFIWHGNVRLWENSIHSTLKQSYTEDLSWGDTDTPLTISTPERAICETLVDVPNKISFEHADQLMQGLTSLSPRRIEKMLHQFKHIKAKRLFFWLAERNHHTWLKKLVSNSFDLGKGKRVIAKEGKLQQKYQITIPSEMYGENNG